MDINPFNRRRTDNILCTTFFCIAFSLCLSTCACAAARAAAADAEQSNDAASAPDGPEWHTDYVAAHSLAKREQRMLLVDFTPEGDSAAQRSLDEAIKKDQSLARRLQSVVLVRLPRDYESDQVGIEGPLVKHAAFKDLIGRTGIAIIDLRNPDVPYYGKVVTVLPYSSGKYYRWRPSHLKVALGLPPGTLTQRTMIWAVRIHPESPASTAGKPHPALEAAATRHSEYQARVQVQGHQNWDSRFQQVSSRAGAGDAKEVVAESWPDQNMIDSCIDCVASWRHSPGHWQAVRGRHRLFSYDIRRGRNGIWYGTGIFAN